MCHPKPLWRGGETSPSLSLKIPSTISSGSSLLVFHPKLISSLTKPRSFFAIASKFLGLILFDILLAFWSLSTKTWYKNLSSGSIKASFLSS